MNKKSITITTTKNEILKGFVLQNESFAGKRPAVLVLHGWTSSTRRYTERVAPLVEAGYTCLLFDMRGHGETGYDLDKYSRKDHLDDCLAAYDFLAQYENVDASKISVLGSSYGGYMTALLAEQRPAHRLILLAPAQYQNEMFDEPQLAQDPDERRAYREQHHDVEDHHALTALHEFDGQVLLVQPEQDEQVPAQVFVDWVEAGGNKVTHVVMPGADHSFYNGDTNQEMIQVVAKWMVGLDKHESD